MQPSENTHAAPQVVHIDLGIAFEQGRFLTTPELVPFRLTRDIVDGMGSAGARRTLHMRKKKVFWCRIGLLHGGPRG